jgi:hypothetical protein
VDLARREENVEKQVGQAVQKTAWGFSLDVRNKLEKVITAPRLAIALHFDAEDACLRALPQKVDAALLKSRVVLNVVDVSAGVL